MRLHQYSSRLQKLRSEKLKLIKSFSAICLANFLISLLYFWQAQSLIRHQQSSETQYNPSHTNTNNTTTQQHNNRPCYTNTSNQLTSTSPPALRKVVIQATSSSTSDTGQYNRTISFPPARSVRGVMRTQQSCPEQTQTSRQRTPPPIPARRRQPPPPHPPVWSVPCSPALRYSCLSCDMIGWNWLDKSETASV